MPTDDDDQGELVVSHNEMIINRFLAAGIQDQELSEAIQSRAGLRVPRLPVSKPDPLRGRQRDLPHITHLQWRQFLDSIALGCDISHSAKLAGLPPSEVLKVMRSGERDIARHQSHTRDAVFYRTVKQFESTNYAFNMALVQSGAIDDPNLAMSLLEKRHNFGGSEVDDAVGAVEDEAEVTARLLDALGLSDE